MYFSNQIRQIKFKKNKNKKECALKKTKKEEEEEEDSMDDKRKERLLPRRGLQQHGEGRVKRRDERREGASFAQSREMR